MPDIRVALDKNGGKRMKKRVVAILMALVMVFAMAACGDKGSGDSEVQNGTEKDGDGDKETTDYSWNTVRMNTTGNTTQIVDMVTEMAKEAGFSVSFDDSNVINGADAVIQAANANKDADFLFGFNDTIWNQLLNGAYENLTVMDWTPSWADLVGDYVMQDKAYGISIQNVLLLYRTDEYGTNGKTLDFEHWTDIMDSGYTWYRQNKIGGTTNTNINSCLLYPYVDPDSEAGGISIEGWKKLWRYCAEGTVFNEDSYGFEPLNRGDVQISFYYTSDLYSSILNAADTSDHPLVGTTEPENWKLLEVQDGTYYIAEYMGIVDRSGRTEEETEVVKAFAEWYGSTEVRAIFSEDQGTFPCNTEAAEMIYPDGVPEIFTGQKNLALTEVGDTGMTYLEYVNEHITEWNNIQTNLGFYWSNQNSPVAEPDWDNIDWETITKSGS